MRTAIVVKFSFLVLFSSSLGAQEVTFNKKSGEFKSGEEVIAKLETEKVKSIGKNYLIKDKSGVNTLLAYNLHSLQDTFGGPIVYYYSIHYPASGYEAQRPNFTESLNTFKEVGEHVIANHLLQPDGRMNEEAVKTYFQTQIAANTDYKLRHSIVNDSLMKLVNIPAELVERDLRKPITANEYGKIGQGNVVIGYWEYIENVAKTFTETTTHLFLIRNIKGGIVCVSWIELSGAHTYVFKDGMRSEEHWTVPDFIHNNPLDNKGQYISQLAAVLVKGHLL